MSVTHWAILLEAAVIFSASSASRPAAVFAFAVSQSACSFWTFVVHSASLQAQVLSAKRLHLLDVFRASGVAGGQGSHDEEDA